MYKSTKRLILLAVTVAGLSGCVQPMKPPHVQASLALKSVNRTYAIPHFNQVVISGAATVALKGQQSQNLVTAYGPPDVLEKDLSVKVQDGVLYINDNDPVTLNVMATGDLVLSRVEVSDNAVLHAYWINSSNLHVKAFDRAKIFLAGIVTKLDIVAKSNSEVDAKYLRADDAFVSTSGSANVGVTVKKNLSTSSTGRSTVYYYRDAELGLHYLAQSGSALRML